MASENQSMNDSIDYLSVSEITDDEVSQEQIQRMVNRYAWAAAYCENKDAIEVACGSGQGLGILLQFASTLQATDYSQAMVGLCNDHYQDRVHIQKSDAAALPLEDESVDVVMLLEALYYLPDPGSFFREANRVLRPGGHLLIVTANKDLYDFNPSPHSYRYLGVLELSSELKEAGYETTFYGGTPVQAVSLKQKILRPVKKAAVALKLVPETMSGKKWLKRLVFGKLKPLPAELSYEHAVPENPVLLDATIPDRSHKVIYCAAVKKTPVSV